MFRKWVLFLGLTGLVLIIMSSGCAQQKYATLPSGGNEFSAAPLSEDWTFENPSGEDQFRIAAGRLILNVDAKSEASSPGDHASKLLKPALEGDWHLDTHLVSFEANTIGDFASQTGLTIYKDSDNWLMWGLSADRELVVNGVIDHTATGDIVKIPLRSELLKILKRTNDGPYTRYYFYYSEDRAVWNNAGYFEDKTGSLDGASYGLMGISYGVSYEVGFDYLTDYIPVNSIDKFLSLTLDPIWSFPTDSSSKYRIERGSISLQASAGDSYLNETNGPLLLRHPKHNDWIIDTLAANKPSSTGHYAGLIIYQNEDNWLFWGNTDGNSSTVVGEISGKILKPEIASTQMHERFRMTKEGSVYTFESSDDGIHWSEAGSWDDKNGDLMEARYGLTAGSHGNIQLNASFHFFRERVVPNGEAFKVSKVGMIDKLTGQQSMNNTMEKYDLGGADLGSMIESKDKVYMMFGDNFAHPRMGGAWRSNALAIITEDQPEDGLSFDRMIINEDFGLTQVKEVIRSKHIDFDEMTVIPTGGIAHHDKVTGQETLYYAYMSVYHWGIGGHWDSNYSGIAFSTDEGENWTKAAEPKWGPNSNFIQMNLVKDESVSPAIVYIYGVPSGGFGAIQLMKVAEDSMLDASSYSYYTGQSMLGRPQWSAHEEDAVSIVPSPVRGELSVMYNRFLNRWIMTYLNEDNHDIEMRDAPEPWGPWSNPVTLVDHTLYFVNGPIYGAYMSPKFVKNNGEKIYFAMSEWTDYNVYWMEATFDKE